MKKRLYCILPLLLAALLFTGCGTGAPTSGSSADRSSTTDSSVEASSASGSDLSVDGEKNEGADLTVSFIDVGQGDSTFLQLPNGKTMLIDGGEAEYSETVISYLEELNIARLDYIISTHPHSDHMGGLAAVVERFEIGQIYMPKVQNNTQIFERFLTAIQTKNLKIKTAGAGVTLFHENDLTAEFLAPWGDSYSDLNNYSAVLHLTYKDTAFLFTGDAEKKAEDEILESADSKTIRADVLKVGHHGSAYSTSPEFLQAVSPSFAIISCGVGNKYGHPEGIILDRLNRAGIKTLRTDQLGTIVLTSDGSKITAASKETSAVQPPAQIPAQPPTQPPAQPPTPVPAQSSAEATVYVTETGDRYHRDGCQYLKSSKIPLALSEAKGDYTPCKKCDPPQ